MKKSNPKPILTLAYLILAAYFGFGFSLNPKIENSQEAYVDVASYDEVFIAITNMGRIDWISENGDIIQSQKLEIENPESILIKDNQLFIAGNGSILYREGDEEEFQKLNIGNSNRINCLANFKNNVIAGYDMGKLRTGNPEKSFYPIKLNLKGNIVSLSSGSTICYGITDQGEIIHTSDGINWDIFDFNKTYNGYYKSCSFLKVLVTPKQIAVIGKNDDDTPALYFSSKGKVWTQRPLNYDDDEGNSRILIDTPSDMYYDSFKDQYILLCPNGKVMTIPSCSHCHKLYDFPENKFSGISGNERTVIVVGDNNYIQTINAEFL